MSKKRATQPQRALEWGWVGTIARDAAEITPDMRLRTCGLARANKWPLCANGFAQPDDGDARGKKRPRLDKSCAAVGDDDDDYNDDQVDYECSKKACKANPNCLNWLGQDEWEDGGGARTKFMKANKLGPNPANRTRKLNIPVGLKNLGATCYVNAFLQIWFQHLAFREGVYRCRPSTENGALLESSPVFQLQTTFAGLQHSRQKAFDPKSLADSLKLSAAVQQDAQEFAKLFLDHLDAQFRMQEVASLKSLVPDQFQGKMIYANVCKTCKTRSERPDEFHELVISLKPNCKLQDQLAELLRSEHLTGDNKYDCSTCKSHQNAVRHTELHEIPPVLHFTMVRFVWDASGERRKSKDTIKFPLSIDMGQYLTPKRASCMYDLRGILLHKGGSAHHGHYESQVYDMSRKRWFNFNDDVVEEVDIEQQAKKNATETSTSKPATKRPRSAVIVDSDDDDEVQIIEPPRVENNINYISSRDAYMLVYARRPENARDADAMDVDGEPAVKIPDPPAEAQAKIDEMNSAHIAQCSAYQDRLQKLDSQFAALRDSKRAIYRSWNIIDLADDSVIASRTALTEWLERGLELTSAQGATRKRSSSDATTLDGDTDATAWDGMEKPADSPADAPPAEKLEEIDNSDIECWHRRLDPSKAGEMKRITKAAYDSIVRSTGCIFQPLFRPQDVCEDCVEMTFHEKYYAQAHPKLTEQFDEFCRDNLDETGGVWISKAWLKDWKLKMPKMHKPGVDDPAPDAEEFALHVKCEHGGLNTNMSWRRKIPQKAAELLQTVFIDWKPIPATEEDCPVCQVELNTSKLDRRQRQAEAENEKQHLSKLYIDENRLCENPRDSSERYAIVPASFMNAWYKWLNKPTENPRPGVLDCNELLCQHDLLCIDPNKRGDRAEVRFIPDEDFLTLVELHEGGPHIVARGQNDSVPMRVQPDRDVCDACRTERLSNYESAHVTISFLDEDDPLPTPDAYELSRATTPPEPTKSNGLKRYGLRQKARNKQRREVMVPIQRHNLVKAIKVEISQEYRISVQRQRLFLRGMELSQTQTISEAGILPGDVLELRAERASNEAYSTRGDEGFGGTLLSGNASARGAANSAASSSPSLKAYEPALPEDTVEPSGKPCPMCTFANEPNHETCEVCEAPL
ncbi:cysteine proteinase [Auricularia subglabra TFB-10046 SS5]|nr:cysteine proteinase [Auricularia subglabra TFB-10046 SS5]